MVLLYTQYKIVPAREGQKGHCPPGILKQSNSLLRGTKITFSNILLRPLNLDLDWVEFYPAGALA